MGEGGECGRGACDQCVACVCVVVTCQLLRKLLPSSSGDGRRKDERQLCMGRGGPSSLLLAHAHCRRALPIR